MCAGSMETEEQRAPLRCPAGATLGSGAVLGVLGGLLAKAAAVWISAAHGVSTCSAICSARWPRMCHTLQFTPLPQDPLDDWIQMQVQMHEQIAQSPPFMEDRLIICMDELLEPLGIQ